MFQETAQISGSSSRGEFTQIDSLSPASFKVPFRKTETLRFSSGKTNCNRTGGAGFFSCSDTLKKVSPNWERPHGVRLVQQKMPDQCIELIESVVPCESIDRSVFRSMRRDKTFRVLNSGARVPLC